MAEGATELEGIPVLVHSSVPLSEAVVETEIAKLKYQLNALLKKERLADLLQDKIELSRLHAAVKVLSYGRETPRANVEIYRKKRARMDPSILHSKINFKGIRFWDYEEAQTALNEGKRIPGLRLNNETGKVERMDKRVASMPKNILVSDWVVLMEGSNFDREGLQDSFKELS